MLADGLVIIHLACLLDVLGFVALMAARLSHTAFLLMRVDLAQGLDVVGQLVIGSRQRLVSLFLGREASLKCFYGDGSGPARQETVSTPSQCHEAARKVSGTPCRTAR